MDIDYFLYRPYRDSIIVCTPIMTVKSKCEIRGCIWNQGRGCTLTSEEQIADNPILHIHPECTKIGVIKW